MENNYRIPHQTQRTEPEQDSQEIIFALDIGTRSVVGVVGTLWEDGFEVLDFEQRFHANRAMRDGQIEDIALVAKVVDEVKTRLEQRNSLSLGSVAIAAAGRSLKTVKVQYQQTIEINEEITSEAMCGMEYAALSQAMDVFKSQGPDNDKFYCVGYSVIRSALDDYNMSNLVGHKGNVVSLELIVAFLPHNVVEGLYASMSLNNLTVDNLTLEPMAAIYVIVPKDIRLLNIALIDIGAGTSDIAISRNGGISAYDMVTVAGDEITEKIMETYLTDFDEAEKIKLALSRQTDHIQLCDILGNNLTVTPEEVMELIQPTVQSLVDSICECVVEINGGSPVAVFVVGGGSQIPGLCSQIAQKLKIAENRVTIGGKQGLKHIRLCSEQLKSPEFVTPIGIGAIIGERRGKDFFAITVNGNKIMLLRQGVIKVMDAILLAGIKPTTLIGIPQVPIHYYVNGEKRSYRTSEQTPGEIRINGETASVDSVVNPGDELSIVPARVTKKDELIAGMAAGTDTYLHLEINGQRMVLKPVLTVNGETAEDSRVIIGGDVVGVAPVRTMEDLCRYLAIDASANSFTINGVYAEPADTLSDDDKVRYELIAAAVQGAEQSTAQSSGSSMEQSTDIGIEQSVEETTVQSLGQSANQTTEQSAVQSMEQTTNTEVGGEQPSQEEPAQEEPGDKVVAVCINGAWRNLTVKPGERLLFVDMLNLVSIDKEEPRGELILRVNSAEARYTQPISHGDVVEIRWQE